MITYEDFIQNILDTRGRFACGDEYHERHHIVPKCMNGTDDEGNLIDLFAREHFVAHKLLAAEHPDNYKLIYAWHMMSIMNNGEKRNYEITAEEYEEARIAHSKACSERMAGENNPMYGKISAMYGKHLPESAKRKLSEERKGENNPMYGRSGENTPNYGKKWSEETREKFLEANSGENHWMYGKHHPEETKEKMRKASKTKRSVICITTGAIYESIMEASRQTGIYFVGIIHCCKGKSKSAGKDPVTGEKLVWKYYDEYVKQTDL